MKPETFIHPFYVFIMNHDGISQNIFSIFFLNLLDFNFFVLSLVLDAKTDRHILKFKWGKKRNKHSSFPFWESMEKSLYNESCWALFCKCNVFPSSCLTPLFAFLQPSFLCHFVFGSAVCFFLPFPPCPLFFSFLSSIVIFLFFPFFYASYFLSIIPVSFSTSPPFCLFLASVLIGTAATS